MIALPGTHYQDWRWYKRYYHFIATTSEIDRYYTGHRIVHFIPTVKTNPGDEVIFDWWRKCIITGPTICVDFSCQRIYSSFKTKYEIVFKAQHLVQDWYIENERYRLSYAVAVVPGVTYVLDTLMCTLEKK